uniref:tetratricopeptide repeat protein n=1 Tax=Brevundimonas sp. TaxID=1871086 RepID=UPI00378510CB
ALLAGLGLTAALAAGLYVLTGTPGLPDQPYAARVDEWATGATPLEPVQVAAVLARDAAAEPENMQLQSMLGAARFQAGDSIGAASAFRRVLAADPNDARSWARLGESLVRSQDGVVGADAEAAFREAARRDPGQLGALYFLGEAAMARADIAGVRATWTPLIAALDPTDPRRADLIQRLARIEAGERTPPPEPTS